MIDLSALKNALASLDRGIQRSKTSPEDEELRDAVIQRFEYTFELSWKMIKRQLENDLPVPSEVDLMSYKEMMRVAAERGLVDEVVSWFVYREQRNATSHTYSREKAESVYKTAVDFFDDAKELLCRLDKCNES
jgi:nucleotidyltransferase substrate binding protein (TIGR01987 family)